MTRTASSVALSAYCLLETCGDAVVLNVVLAIWRLQRQVTVQGWLYDVKNTASPQVLGKQYADNATDEAVRVIAHKLPMRLSFA